MKPKYTALLPFGLFLIVFITLNIVYSDIVVRDNFPIFAAFIALIASFFTFPKNVSLNEKVDVFIQGSTQTTVIHMCYIFYLSTVFTAILEQTGGIMAAVNLSLLFIPTWSVLPGVFIVASLFSFTVGTSMGAIAAFMPIAIDLAYHLSLDPSLMAATIICGAMFGDNLSILSDTTITAVRVTNAKMKDKLILNSKVAAPAFLASIAVLTYQSYLAVGNIPTSNLPIVSSLDFIKILPYLASFCLAFVGFDILIVLILGIALAIGIGICLNSLTFLQAIDLMFNGFYENKGMVNVFILVLLLSSLSKIMTYNGGIDYLINKLKSKVSSEYYAKIAIFAIVTIINITIAINTIAIMISGPVAKDIGDDYNISNTQVACILDIGSCISQGLLPYSPQLLLAASMAQVSAVSLIPYLYYQFFLAISLLVMIIWKKDKS